MTVTNIYYLYETGGKKNQEDYIWPKPGAATDSDRCFIVCDGVGGSENGEIASKIIAEYIGHALKQPGNPPLTAAWINELLDKARMELTAYAVSKGLSTDMATTFSLLVLREETAFIAWCGDSRVFHIRGGVPLYKTADHSLVNTLVKNGEISEEEALAHPQRNVILKAVKAGEEPIDAEAHEITGIQEGDYFLLCTDGLLENIVDKDLKFLLSQNDAGKIELVNSFQQFCAGKTRDNYSMYLIKTGVSATTGAGASAKKSRWLITTLLLMLAVLGAAWLFRDQQPLPAGLPQVKLADSMVTVKAPVDTIAPLVVKEDESPYVEIVPTEEKRAGKTVPLSDSLKRTNDSASRKIKTTVKLKDSLPEKKQTPEVLPKEKIDSNSAEHH